MRRFLTLGALSLFAAAYAACGHGTDVPPCNFQNDELYGCGISATVVCTDGTHINDLHPFTESCGVGAWVGFANVSKPAGVTCTLSATCIDGTTDTLQLMFVDDGQGRGCSCSGDLFSPCQVNVTICAHLDAGTDAPSDTGTDAASDGPADAG